MVLLGLVVFGCFAIGFVSVWLGLFVLLAVLCFLCLVVSLCWNVLLLCGEVAYHLEKCL